MKNNSTRSRRSTRTPVSSVRINRKEEVRVKVPPVMTIEQFKFFARQVNYAIGVP